MGRRGPAALTLELSEDERVTLERWAKRPETEQSLALRCQIVLACAEGAGNTEVGVRLRVHPATVGKWRRRFAEQRLDGLHDEPRPGAPRRYGDDDIEAVVVKTLTEKPVAATHWSSRDMAKATGMSQPWMVARAPAGVWTQAVGDRHLQAVGGPAVHREGPKNVVGLYMDPPDHAVVCCVDEKAGIQALDRTQPILPMRPGQVERRTHDYRRNGLTDLFAALNVATGEVLATTRRRHRAAEFIDFLNEIDKAVPADLDLHVVLDNSKTHKTPAVQRWLLRHPRFRFHFTPTSSSWLNLVERWFAELTWKPPQRSAHRNATGPREGPQEMDSHLERRPPPIRLAQDRGRDRKSLGRYCQRISDSGH